MYEMRQRRNLEEKYLQEEPLTEGSVLCFFSLKALLR